MRLTTTSDPISSRDSVNQPPSQALSMQVLLTGGNCLGTGPYDVILHGVDSYPSLLALKWSYMHTCTHNMYITLN